MPQGKTETANTSQTHSTLIRGTSATSHGHLSRSPTWPFAGLPLELICQVFEIAANHPPTAYSLCMVSKVAGLGTGQALEVPNAHLVRNLYLSPNVHIVDLQACTKLQNLASSAHLLLRARICSQEIPTLTHLTIHDLSDHIPLMDILNQMFPSLTHLYITNSVAFPQYNLRLPAILFRLTHIVWGGNIVFSVNALSRFLGSLEVPEELRVIGLQSQMALDPGPIVAYHVEQQIAAAVRACSFHHKHKIVVMPNRTHFGSSDWNDWYQGGEDIWETADRLLSQHQQSQAWQEVKLGGSAT